MYSLKDDKSIIIKGCDKGAAVNVLDCENYLKVVSKQLEDKEVLEVPNDVNTLVSTFYYYYYFCNTDQYWYYGEACSSRTNGWRLKLPF